MTARELLNGPFAVINSDDYYGADAFAKVYDFLAGNDGERTFCMGGYYVENTLSDQGTVTRGVCMTEGGYLTGIDETKEIDRGSYGVITDAMMDELVSGFPAFLDSAMKNDPMKAEYLFPIEVGKLLSEDKYCVLCAWS